MIERKEGLMHLVILGAGATCAAYPDGDLNGSPIPGMDGFMQKTGLIEKFPGVREEIEAEPNLEKLFSKWNDAPERLNLRRRLENEIYEYMSNLRPRGEDLYSKLLSGLTDRDVIATFNWDPFLAEAYEKVSISITHDLPRILFLHGNVAAGYCPECMKVGYIHEKCEKCGKDLVDMPLLYPVENKKYNENIYIRGAWEDLKKAVRHASMITFFGYSAPSSDAAAVNMMQEAFGKDPLRNMVEFQLINTGKENKLRSAYRAFGIKQNHMSIVASFFDSYIARFPRRSADYFFRNTMMCTPVYPCRKQEETAFKEGDDIRVIKKKVDLLEGETPRVF